MAAPAAARLGIPVAALIALDTSRSLIPRDVTLWERLAGDHPDGASSVWLEVARQLAVLHDAELAWPPHTVRDDAPVRHAALPAVAQKLQHLGALQEVAAWAARLEAFSAPADLKTSIHGDIHRFNVLSGPEDELVALLDWGDAGWGDPAYDLARAPLEALAPMLAAYEAASRRGLGPDARGRILRYRLGRLLRWAQRQSEAPGDLAAFLTFVRHLPDDWRPYGLGA